NLAEFIRLDSALPDRRGVHESALAPERVDAALEPERRLGADIAVEHVPVIPDLLDDLIDPVGLEAEQLAHVVLLVDAEQAPNARVLRALHLIYVRAINAELLGLDHREEHPLHDREQLFVAAADRRAERLL